MIELRFNCYVAAVIKDVGPMLHQIYKLLFPQELIRSRSANVSLDKQTEKSVHTFLREFGIFPGLVSKSEAVQIYLHSKNIDKVFYDEVLDNHVVKLKENARPAEVVRELGHYFTFARFIDFLVRLGRTVFIKKYPFRNVANFEAEMLIRLLEHMEVSLGFRKFL